MIFVHKIKILFVNKTFGHSNLQKIIFSGHFLVAEKKSEYFFPILQNL